nr:bifunctional phosphopantothenoylcysteine decarboxylase/phosphopantothenate--cysteine ligase CoaBC [Saprospiraceae bacterium]
MINSNSTRTALYGKKILLGICGSIAAYKSAYLCRLLVKAGAEVRVTMTRDSANFIGPVTLSTLSKNPVHIDLSEDNQWSDHVEWGLWADLMVIAPVTAHTVAKLANGYTDNMLTATYLSARCPVMAAPAMDLDMWNHPGTRRNIGTLKSDGVQILDVAEGELASGLHGPGRMLEPEDIVNKIESFFEKKWSLKKQIALVTAGPTVEPIDPVRYISNHSSGKMGVAIAEVLASRGAEVHLVHGPLTIDIGHPSIHCHPVQTAGEMLEKCLEIHPNCTLAIFAAAVSDYSVSIVSKEKIKKEGKPVQLNLTANPDVAATCGKRKNGKYHVGFALETQNEIKNARKKLTDKHFDLIVLNSLQDEGAGFNKDTNKVTFIEQNKMVELELKTKVEVAEDLVQYIEQKINR